MNPMFLKPHVYWNRFVLWMKLERPFCDRNKAIARQQHDAAVPQKDADNKGCAGADFCSCTWASETALIRSSVVTAVPSNGLANFEPRPEKPFQPCPNRPFHRPAALNKPEGESWSPAELLPAVPWQKMPVMIQATYTWNEERRERSQYISLL